MSHEINPYQQDDFLVLGRFLSEETYKKDKKEIHVDNISIDIIRKGKDIILAGEVKKSSRSIEAATMQLSYYLLILKKKGIFAKGVLLFPTEKRKIEIVLDEVKIKELEQTMESIKELISLPKPPKVTRIKFCRNCAYKEFCFS